MTAWEQQRILVTRPAHQAQGLINLLSSKGACVLLFPTLVIHPVNDLNALKETIQQQFDADWLIFISPNAVDHVLPLIKQEQWLPRFRGRFATVGAGTRDTLASYGINNIVYPLNDVGALALLETLSQENFENKHVTIFKADSENQILEEGLAARGAQLFPIICYQRLHSKEDPEPLIHALEHDHINLIVTTSGDGLKSLVHLIPTALRSTLYQLPVVVVSERVQNIAKTFGFSTILLAHDPSDEAIVSAIDQWKNEGASHV